jgi:hypothetical protein
VTAVGSDGRSWIHVDLAAPEFIADRDTGDEHAYPRISAMTSCPECGAPREPEPTDEERRRIFDDVDYEWQRPDGLYLCGGYGLMGGGFGFYVTCDRCGFFTKEQTAED